MSRRRVRVVERLGGQLHLRFHGKIEAGRPVTFGRDADVSVGVEPIDGKVSRWGAVVTATDRGWLVNPTNRGGVVLHRWGQAPYEMPSPETIAWPRVGLRIVGRDDIEHWVLLEDDETYTVGADPHTTGLTEVGGRPSRLTPEQRQAVGLVFSDLLSWPPLVAAKVLLLKQAATRIARSTAAVQGRLEAVRAKARALGLNRDGELTDPEYVYFLVRAGYIEPETDDMDPLLRV